jgi:hypothetical protein
VHLPAARPWSALALVQALGALLSVFGCRRDPTTSAAQATRISTGASPGRQDASAAPGVAARALGSAAPAPAAQPSAASALSAAVNGEATPRVYAKTRFVWIRSEPAPGEWIGYLWFGGSVPLRERAPRAGLDCSHYYAIEPRGFVCVDGKSATLDPVDPVLAQIRPYAPRIDTPWPHQYGESRNTKLYRSIPSPETQRLTEADYTGQLARILRARGGDIDPLLQGVDVSQAHRSAFELVRLPSTIHENRTRLRLHSTVAWSTEVDQGDRSWLLTHDLQWVPKDRVAPYPKVTFRGVRLGTDAKLPLAFFRGKDRPKYRRDGSAWVATGEKWARLSWVELTGQRLEHAGEVYLETRDRGLWVQKFDAVVPTPQSTTPWGAPIGGADQTGLAPKGRGTWIEVSVLGGWLLAYAGTQPVFATLLSAGRGGIPIPGRDPLETASTPTGIFNVNGKFATATMEAPNQFIHSEVPWTQNFRGPHALHGAYWHDNWGHGMSAGCINVSPADGRYLFEFTEPSVPAGWHGVRWLPWLGPATIFVVHR